jgi:hypothetical protein
MARKFLTPIDLGKLELQNARIQNLSTSNKPATPVEGQIYYDTDDHVLKTWNGTAWITSNQGIQGETGAQGTEGAQGTTGAQGETGTQGADGSNGAQGAEGAQGTEGAQGAEGAQGIQGEQGLQGFEGLQGIQGEQGVQGYEGAQGIEGAQGTTGAQGETGTQGEQGLQGAEGMQGAQGENAGIMSVGSGLSLSGGGELTVDTTTIATKSYVDATAQGLDVKQSVDVATTGPITLSGEGLNDDGNSYYSGQRVLVKNQATTINNGIYAVNKDGAWSKTIDGTTNTGAFTFVETGPNAGKGFVQLADGTWSQFSESGQYITSANTTSFVVTSGELALQSTVAGDGIDLTSGVLSVSTTLSGKTLENPTVSLTPFSSSNAQMSYQSSQWVISQTGHTFQTGDTVTISGATTGEFFDINGSWTVDFVSGNYWSAAAIRAGVGETPFYFASNWGTFTGAASGSSVTVSSTELGYLDGVTSAIQTQLNAKVGRYTTVITPESPYSQTSWTLTHGLGTKNAIVNVRDTFGNIVETDLSTGTDTVTVGFAVAPASGETYTVVVHV